MNTIYRIVWNAARQAWVVASEAATARGKSKSAACAIQRMTTATAASAMFALLPVEGWADTVTVSAYTPGTANYYGQVVNVSGDITDMTGLMSWTDSTGGEFIQKNIEYAYNHGWATGSADPNGKRAINLGSQSNGVTVIDPVTQGSVVVNTYNSANFAETVPGSLYYFYAPTPVGGGPFVRSQVATVSGGGTLNVNVSGDVGNTSVRDTTYFAITNGTLNWNSKNNFQFASNALTVTPEKLLPYDISVGITTYNGTFTVNTNDGSHSQTVNTLSDLKAYNAWLIDQLSAGKLGSGPAAQVAYNNALQQAYTSGSTDYTINPQISPIPAGDPMLSSVGTRIGILANGPNALAHVGAEGDITIAGLIGGVGLRAENGGTVINDGAIRSWRWPTGISAASGGRVINNGVRQIGSGLPNTTEATADIIVGVGTTYINNGTVNIGMFGYDPTYTAHSNWLFIDGGAAGINNGAVNVGTNSPAGLGTGQAVGVKNGSTFNNTASGLIYLGREASSDTTSAPIARGGADTAQPNSINGIVVESGGIAHNDGTIIIGGKVQDGKAISISGTGVAVINSGTIEVRGHYNDTPLTNIGIYSKATTGSVENSGTINLSGTNGVGMKLSAGAKAISNGTINVGPSSVTVLPNFGLWSEGSGSNITLSGTVNLTGDGAIGVHARDGGGVIVADAGAVNFLGGTRQIGYFVNGIDSTITNTAFGAQNVASADSILFRIDGGASFDGSGSSVLTASGSGSQAMVVSGFSGSKPSSFNSGGMTLDLAGAGVAAVRIEGGAQGKLANTAVINLNDAAAIGAVAGIVDGQAYDLTGAASGSVIAGSLSDATKDAGAAGFGSGTILVSGATLNSALDNVTGYIARNGAEVNNSGNIVFSGHNATGLRVEAGARGDNTGSIQVGAGSVGILAQDASGTQTTVVNTSGNLVLTDGNLASRSTGIRASGAMTTVNMSAGNLALNSVGAIGVEASAGATVNLTGTTSASFSATDQILFYLSGAGTQVNANLAAGVALDASGTRSTLYRLDNGAALSGNWEAEASGTGARAIELSGANTSLSLGAGQQLNVSGDSAVGLFVSGGANATVASNTIMLLASGATAGIVDGNRYGLDGSVQATSTGATLTNATNFASTQAGAVGFVSQNKGLLVNSDSINLSGADAIGVKIVSGSLQNSGNVSANNIAVYVEGASSTIHNSGQIIGLDGHAAVELGNAANLNLVGTGLGTIEGRGTAHALLVDTGAAGLSVNGAHLIVNAAGSTGHGIENAGELAGIVLSNTAIDVTDGVGVRTGTTLDRTNSGTINVTGSGVGLAFQNADGSQSVNNLDLSASQGLTITVSGAGGRGIVANSSGVLDIAATVQVVNSSGGSALVLGTGVDAAINRGNLSSTSTAAPTVSALNTGRVVNAASGVISATGSPTAAALAFGSQGANFTNQGRIEGQVILGNGTNQALLATGSQLNGILAGGSGDDTVTLQHDAGFRTLDGGAGGTDRLVFDAAQYTHASTSGQIQRFDTVQLSNGSTLTLEQVLAAAKNGSDTNTIAIDAGSTLAVAPAAGGFVLNNGLSGAGTVRTATNGAAFDFGSATAASSGAAFSGTLALGASTLDLGGANTIALTQATLRSEAGSVTTVGNGNQMIGGLDIHGGALVFHASAPEQGVNTSLISTETLDASHAGTIRIQLPAPYLIDPPDTPNTVNLLAQDDANIGIQLVSATHTVGYASMLTLQDQDQNTISAPQWIDISQHGNAVARAAYDYRLTTASGDGLYVNYGLTQVDLQPDQILTLAQNTGAAGAASDLSAQITGSGQLAINARGGTVSLSNGTNTYRGDTHVQSGTLRLEADGALGQTAILHIADMAQTDLNGKTQTIQAIDNQSGATLYLAGGTLEIADGGISAGVLTGAGQLNLAGGSLIIEAGNPGLTANIAIASTATVRMNDAAGLGTGAIDHAGQLILDDALGMLTNPIKGTGSLDLIRASQIQVSGDNRAFGGRITLAADTALTVMQAQNLGTATIANAGQLIVDTPDDWTLDNTVSGTGSLVKRGAGTLMAGAALNYSGSTVIEAGTLIVGDARQPNITLGAANAHSVTVESGATLAGQGTVSGHVLNRGTLVVLDALSSQAPQASHFTLAGGLTNRGTVQLAGATVGNTLTVRGDAVGIGGRIVMNTEFGADSATTDRLILDGGRASGDTALTIRRAGGQGAPTQRGIRLIETQNGATTDANAFHLSPDSDGYRQGVGTVVTGPYEYRLIRGGTGGDVEDWYLVSGELSSTIGGDANSDPIFPSAPASYRSEVGAYLNNKFFSTTLPFHTLRERIAQANSTPQATQEAADDTTIDAGRNPYAWGRLAGGSSRRTGAGMELTDTTYIVQLGSDLIRTSDGASGEFRFGGMGLYGHSDNRATPDGRNGQSARGTVDGFNLGVYATWFQHAKHDVGMYVDGWLLYGMFDNEVDGAGLPTERYRANHLAASLEAGYGFLLHSDPKMRLTLEPQVQAIASRYHANAHVEHSGTRVTSPATTDVTLRVGVRVAGHFVNDDATQSVQPFAEINWWHSPAEQSLQFDEIVVSDALPANRFETKLGLQAELSPQLALWGAAGFDRDTRDYMAAKIQAGIKFAW